MLTRAVLSANEVCDGRKEERKEGNNIRGTLKEGRKRKEGTLKGGKEGKEGRKPTVLSALNSVMMRRSVPARRKMALTVFIHASLFSFLMTFNFWIGLLLVVLVALAPHQEGDLAAARRGNNKGCEPTRFKTKHTQRFKNNTDCTTDFEATISKHNRFT